MIPAIFITRAAIQILSGERVKDRKGVLVKRFESKLAEPVGKIQEPQF